MYTGARITNAQRGDAILINSGADSAIAQAMNQLGLAWSHSEMMQVDTGQFIAENAADPQTLRNGIQYSVVCPSHQPFDPSYVKYMGPGIMPFRGLTPTDATYPTVVIYDASEGGCPSWLNFGSYQIYGLALRQYNAVCTDYLIDSCGFMNPPASGLSFQPWQVQSALDTVWGRAFTDFYYGGGESFWQWCDAVTNSMEAANQIVNELGFGNGWVSHINLTQTPLDGLGGTGAPPVINGGGAIAPDQLTAGKAVAGATWEGASYLCVPDCQIQGWGCGPICGNNTCESGEDCSTCPYDCGTCGPVCGNGACEGGETCSTCAADCGACPPPPSGAMQANSAIRYCAGYSEHYIGGRGSAQECYDSCAGYEAVEWYQNGDCYCEHGTGCQVVGGFSGWWAGLRSGASSPVCGNGACESGEDCGTCASDCGACPPSGGGGSGVLGAGEVLYPNQSVVSTDGRFTFVYQGDGNLVLYQSGTPLWASGTVGAAGFTAMQGDGNLVVYNAWSEPVWWSGTNGYGGAWLAVQNDGNVVVYSSWGSPLWYTGTCCR